MSRPRSSRGASSASRSVPAQRGVYVAAPKSDVYVALLGVALGAMIVGCLLLVLVLKNYDFKTKVGVLAPVSQAPALANLA